MLNTDIVADTRLFANAVSVVETVYMLTPEQAQEARELMRSGVTIEQIAANNPRIETAYIESSSLCTPSRASTLTGGQA